MARYLTPARLCTLMLIEIYFNEDFWTYQPDTATAVLQLISEQGLQTSEYTALDLEKSTVLPRNVLEYGKSLAAFEAEVPGRTWLNVLVRELWRLHTVDQLHDLVEHCMQYLVATIDEDSPSDQRAPTATRASPVGQFIRKCHVEFTRLQFAETLTLWQSFVAYREPSREMLAHSYPDAARAALTASVQSMGGTPKVETLSDSTLVGPEAIDNVLGASIWRLQMLGQRLPPQVKTKLEAWLSAQQATRTQALHHLMSFFEAWRAGQYSLALENIHRYFDYSVAKTASDSMKVHYQYALLHLSILHADFEHWDESVSAMKECIATARENQDTACLNYALSWMLFLRQSRHTKDSSGLRSLAAIAGEGGSERDEIAFLKAKARDSKHWTLMSSTLMEEAKLELRNHGVCARAAELVLQSSYINVQHGLISTMPATTTFQAAMYDRLGQAHLSQHLHTSALTIYGPHSALSDSARIICRLAYDAAQQGIYKQSLAMLQDFRPRIEGVLKLEQRFTAFAELLALMRAVRASDLEAAEYHSINLRPIRDTADPDVSGLIEQQETALLMKRHQYDVALEKLNESIMRSKQQDGSDVAEILSLLIQKANLFAAVGRPRKGFTTALRAASRAQRAHLVVLFTEALNALARILNDLGKCEAARELCEAALPHALEGCNTLVVAQLFVSLGESYVGLITATPGSTPLKQSQLAHIASSHIERGREVYEQIEEYEGQLDCLLMLAKLARWLDDEPSAERADAKYYQLVVEHQNRRRS